MGLTVAGQVKDPGAGADNLQDDLMGLPVFLPFLVSWFPGPS